MGFRAKLAVYLLKEPFSSSPMHLLTIPLFAHTIHIYQVARRGAYSMGDTRMSKDNLTTYIRDELLSHGADMVGIGSLRDLPPKERGNLPIGICVAIKYPASVIRSIGNMPTKEYYDWYKKLNERLDLLVSAGALALQMERYRAVAQTREVVGNGGEDYRTTLPHKTVAVYAGLGWIGKSGLLVTETYGSMIRISSILTNAPLQTEMPITQSKCGDCTACRDACPAGAISGNLWKFRLDRDELLDPEKCAKVAKERAKKSIGVEETICGKCIEVCPYTKRAMKDSID